MLKTRWTSSHFEGVGSWHCTQRTSPNMVKFLAVTSIDVRSCFFLADKAILDFWNNTHCTSLLAMLLALLALPEQIWRRERCRRCKVSKHLRRCGMLAMSRSRRVWMFTPPFGADLALRLKGCCASKLRPCSMCSLGLMSMAPDWGIAPPRFWSQLHRRWYCIAGILLPDGAMFFSLQVRLRSLRICAPFFREAMAEKWQGGDSSVNWSSHSSATSSTSSTSSTSCRSAIGFSGQWQ